MCEGTDGEGARRRRERGRRGCFLLSAYFLREGEDSGVLDAAEGERGGRVDVGRVAALAREGGQRVDSFPEHEKEDLVLFPQGLRGCARGQTAAAQG